MFRFKRGALAVGLLAMAFAAASCGSSGDGAADVEGGNALGNPAADCLAYDEATLLGQDFAFDGTFVSGSADGTEGTFDVHAWYRGGEGSEITLGVDGLLGEEAQALIGTSLVEGQRYLISGSDGFVWACGYSVTYDSELASEWAELFVA